ncbi:MAG TPA: methyltransferase [Trebonia sp.]|nr:methyltransferase [Trebonia sp.]
MTPAPGHYFDARPSAAHRPGQVRVVLPDLYLELETDSGMFSPGRLDPGTRFLLESGPPPPASGDLLDLGCGYGPIACTLAARAPGATVWAVDVNERALSLCAANAARAGLANVRCAAPGSAEIPARLAGIWSNPPVRIGKGPLHALLRDWLPRLAPGASATLVMGRNLGADSLHAWLEKEEGWPVTRLSARAGYRLLRVTAPGDPERRGDTADGR